MSNAVSLTEVLHVQNDELWNVVALLDSMVKAIDAKAVIDMSNISRTMRIARDKVRAVQDELQPFI
jgi:hypothetical protein